MGWVSHCYSKPCGYNGWIWKLICSTVALRSRYHATVAQSCSDRTLVCSQRWECAPLSGYQSDVLGGYMFTHCVSCLQNVLWGYGPGLTPIMYNCNHNTSCHCAPEPLRHYIYFQAKLGKCTTLLTLVEWCVGMDEGPLMLCLIVTWGLWGSMDQVW